MRDALSEYEDIPVTLIGTFVRYGRKRSSDESCFRNTILLEDLEFEDGRVACNHLWFIAKNSFMFTELKIGAIVKVSGYVRRYQRNNKTIDYSIEDYIAVEIIKQGDRLIPSKVWEEDIYMYFKFILDEGPRWYRVNKLTKNIERIKSKYVGYDIFEQEIIPANVEDIAFIHKHAMLWVVLGLKIKIKRFS